MKYEEWYNTLMRWREIKQNKNLTQNTKQPMLKHAGFWSRTMAFTTDIFMIGIPITIIIMIFFGYDQMQSAGFGDAVMQTKNAQQHAPNPLASIIQFLLYITTFVLLWRLTGQTPGMKMAGIEIIDVKTLERPSYLQLITRFFSYFLSLFLIGYLWGLFRKDKRMLPDLIARTTLIYKS